MGLEVKASRGAEDIVVGLHQFLLVSVGLQTLRGSLQGLQAGVLRRLYILLCRQVGPQGSVQAGVVAQVTALSQKDTHISTAGHCLQTPLVPAATCQTGLMQMFQQTAIAYDAIN